MLDYEEPQEKPQYNIATPISRLTSLFCLTPLFLVKIVSSEVFYHWKIEK